MVASITRIKSPLNFLLCVLYMLHNIKHKYFVPLLYGLYVGWCEVDIYNGVDWRSFSVDKYQE
jgi:hypothetical protein